MTAGGLKGFLQEQEPIRAKSQLNLHKTSSLGSTVVPVVLPVDDADGKLRSTDPALCRVTGEKVRIHLRQSSRGFPHAGSSGTERIQSLMFFLSMEKEKIKRRK